MFHKYCRIFTVISVLLLCLVAFPALATDDSYVIVEAEGIGIDRASAMDSAWLEGIRQAARNFIDAKTELNNEQLIERIVSYSRGLVEKYEVLSVDDSQAGIYKMKLRMWIVRDILWDGAKHAIAGSSEVSFSASDIRRQQKEELDAKTLEYRNAQAETAKLKAQTAPELLSAMLERYKPEDFLSCYIPGKPEAVKGQKDKFLISVEITFNEKLYKEAFIPDLLQVLDQIAKSKKSITLTKQRDQLRKLSDKNGLPLADTSIICRETGLGSEYQLAVYDRPERFGCRLYGFSEEDKKSILVSRGILDKFCGRTNRVRGILLELIDGNKEVIDTVELDINLPFLVSNNILNYQNWAIHPTIMKYEAMFCYLPLYTEGNSLTFPLVFELPEEFLEDVRSVRASIRLDEKFAEAGVNTRISLNNSAIGYFKKTYKEHEKHFKAEADKGYPLAKVALESINVFRTLDTPNLLIDEFIRRITPAIDNGNIDAMYQAARQLESSPNYEIQKRCVQYYIKAAEKNPAAMIRLGEIYEQGFYAVPVDKKKADTVYAEGLRLLVMLASHDHPNATVCLGRAALEGLGIECNTQLAEICYKFARASGYDDPEFWLWENYGIAMRRINMPNGLKGNFLKCVKNGSIPYGSGDAEILRYSESSFVTDAFTSPRTCFYLVRDKLYVIGVPNLGGMEGVGFINRTTDAMSQLRYSDRVQSLVEIPFITSDGKNWQQVYFDYRKGIRKGRK